MNLSEQSVLITGGAAGIGRHLVENLHTDAAGVVVFDRDEAALRALADQHDHVRCMACDVTDAKAVETAVDRAFGESPPPTVLINNAGMIHSEPLVNLLSREDKKHSVETWQRTIAVNLTSVFLMTRCVAERFVASRIRGAVINVSSISAAGNAGQSAYSAAKAGVNALTVTWAKELGPFGIRVAAVAPGFFDTPSTRASLAESHVKAWTKKTPLARMGDLDEVSRAVRFIIENDFYTGRVLELDGGLRL